MTKFWLGLSPLLRDFIEGLVGAAVGGASGAVLGLNLADATPRSVASYALTGACTAIIAYARHRLADTQNPPPGQ